MAVSFHTIIELWSAPAKSSLEPESHSFIGHCRTMKKGKKNNEYDCNFSCKEKLDGKSCNFSHWRQLCKHYTLQTPMHAFHRTADNTTLQNFIKICFWSFLLPFSEIAHWFQFFPITYIVFNETLFQLY